MALATHVPLARAGAVARPLPAKHGRFIAVQACNGRDTARAGGWLSRRMCHSRGREPRRDRCQRSTAASSRCKRATGVTRRGWAGARRTCLRRPGAAEPRTSFAACRRVLGGLWTEHQSLTRHHERLHSRRRMFLFDHMDVVRDDFALRVSLREVIARRNRTCGSRRKAVPRRAYLPVDPIQVSRCGFRAPRRRRETAGIIRNRSRRAFKSSVVASRCSCVCAKRLRGTSKWRPDAPG